MKNYKDIWQEAYDEALERGHSKDEARMDADYALQDWTGRCVDEAYERWRDSVDFGDSQ